VETVAGAAADSAVVMASSRATASSYEPPGSTLAMSRTVPSPWSSTARSVTSIIASSGMPSSSGLLLGRRSMRRTTS
jgi:hypothetical protein